MGLCPSICLKSDNLNLRDRRISHVVPGEFKDSVLSPSERNNGKFYYIHNEEAIDRTISRLDELNDFTESNAVLLDQTLADLRLMRRNFEPVISHDSAASFYAMNISEAHKKPVVARERTLLRKKSNTFSQNVSHPIFKKKDIKNGVLSVEIQKAKVFEPKLINKYKLVAPHVVIKIYFNKDNKINIENHTFQEIKAYQTLKNESSLTPEWAELFEHQFVEEDRIPLFIIGISLYYLNDKNDSQWQIGQEQYFSISSLLDQNVQIKTVDFKDPIMKGLLASLMVRFQFIYDLDTVKERLLREAKARIERLLKIRESHPVFFNERQARQNVRASDQRRSHGYSILSTSSNHDNDDNNYFVDD